MIEQQPRFDWSVRFWVFAARYLAVPSFAWTSMGPVRDRSFKVRALREMRVLFNVAQVAVLTVLIAGIVLTLRDGWIFQMTFIILIVMQVAIMAIRSQFAFQELERATS